MAFAENAATVQRLRKEREPSRVYFEDPNSWIYGEPEMTDEEVIWPYFMSSPM